MKGNVKKTPQNNKQTNKTVLYPAMQKEQAHNIAEKLQTELLERTPLDL